MSEIKWPKGSHHATFHKQVAENLKAILNGTMLIIDPASIRLGYAVTQAGKVTSRGTIELNARAPIIARLQDIVQTLQADDEYDILGIEMIRGQMAHAYLKFSVGAVMGGTRAPVCIEVPIQTWKAFAGKTHVKSDAGDAEAMAETIVALARQIDSTKGN